MENLDFILSLFNQYCFNDAKNNIESLEYYTSVNPALSGNTLISSLLGAIKNYTFDSIDLPLFQSILMKDRKTPQEQQQIINELLRWKSYGKQQMAPTKKYLEDIIASSIIAKANSKFSNDPMGYLNYLKQSNIKIDRSEALNSQGFDKIDINTIVASESNKRFRSYFDWVNQQFEPYHEVEFGQMCIISAPPGTGKTLWMMTEALNMAITTKEKILYVSLGDMNIRDFIVRMGAIQTGLTFGEAARNLGAIYNNLKQLIGNRLDISINSAGTVSVDELVEYVLARGYSAIFLDYDSNLLMTSSTNSMYLDYGTIYNALTKLTIEGVFVEVGSQPNKVVWKEAEFDLSDLGESSRKGHTTDMAITIGRFPGPNHCGKVKMAKNRRGEEGDTMGYIRLPNGRFRIIPVDLAKQFADREKTLFTDQDVDQALGMYNQSLQALSMAAPGPQKSQKIINPFNKP